MEAAIGNSNSRRIAPEIGMICTQDAEGSKGEEEEWEEDDGGAEGGIAEDPAEWELVGSEGDPVLGEEGGDDDPLDGELHNLESHRP